MAEIRLSKKELSDLIRDDAISVHCPNCAASVYLKLSSAAGPAKEEKKKEEIAVKCTQCGKPISEYAFAVRKGLCTDCWSFSRGTPGA